MMIKIVDCSSWSLSCDLCTINNLIVHDCDQWSVILTMVSHHPSSVSAPVSPVSGAVSDPSWAELCFLCHICCSTVISNSLQNIIQSPLAVLAISGDFITAVAPVSVVGSFLSQQFNNIIGGNMRSWAYDREENMITHTSYNWLITCINNISLHLLSSSTTSSSSSCSESSSFTWRQWTAILTINPSWWARGWPLEG